MTRIAIVSTPRSGNTWLRHMLSEILGTKEIAVHSFQSVVNIPNSVILQIHTYPNDEAINFLMKINLLLSL